MEKAVVTGPTGVIGTALVERLAQIGVDVYAVCRPDSKRIDTIMSHPKVHVVKCDLTELSNLPSQISDSCDVFFHLAWEGTLDPNNRFDMYLQNRNVRYSLDAAKAAKELNCKVFIGAGSQAEYGVKSGVMRPNTFPAPVSGYGMAKLCAGQMTRHMCRQYGIRHIWPRILSVYGIGDGQQTFISSAILKMLDKKRFSMTAGDQIWDYLYSADAAEAFIAMAERGVDGSVYVLGSGQTKTLKEYVTIIRDLVDSTLEIGFGDIPYNQDQVMHMEADNSSLIEETGWHPRTKFEDGVEQVINRLRELHI